MAGELHIVDDEAYVSLVTNDSYALGALVLGHSLRAVHTSRKLALLLTTDVSEHFRLRLAQVWDHVKIVNLFDSEDRINLAYLARPELGVTFTKIHAWNLTQYRKCVFLDADTLVLQNVDELFQREELSAAPDIGWPDCFNSGVFVFVPSAATYEALLEHAVQHGSFDGGDQGLLNSFFSDWATRDISRHLPFLYNLATSSCYSYLPALRRFGDDARIIHFLGPVKPWHHAYHRESRQVTRGPMGGAELTDNERRFVQMWWDTYMNFAHRTAQALREISAGLHYLHLDAPVLPPISESSEEEDLQDMEDIRRRAWECGRPDYMGADMFQNIQNRVEAIINGDMKIEHDTPSTYSHVTDTPGTDTPGTVTADSDTSKA